VSAPARRLLSVEKASTALEEERRTGGETGARRHRIGVRVGDEIHRAVRIRCFKAGVTVEDYLLGLLKADGIG
jgi:hypothetical protein